MTIKMPDAKCDQLRSLAERQGVTLDQLVDQWATAALEQFDAEKRFRARAAKGSKKQGLALLEKLDRAERR
jgi:hypothetical protein